MSATPDTTILDDPLWYKDAIIYQLHVRAFYDKNGDGIGDFQGLVEKLDYLQDLGVTAIWLLPFYPSPLKDDGYDIADYNDVHPSYGTIADVQRFVQEAHRRGLRVINELVCNHTSDQHAWFQQARRAQPGSPERDFYVWSDTDDRYREARIIFKDFERSNWTWDPVAEAYFWHRFYHHQPDLNFENPAVHQAIFDAMDFWLQMGFDGMRLDAIPYLYEAEGTNCENLPETHAFLKSLRDHVDRNFANRMLLAEANQWPEDSVAYFGNGDECHMAFHFPVMPRLYMALRMEDRFPILDIMAQTPPIPPTSQWAIFLRNHDELTLEMVTDEERDYMYRMYAEDPRMRINLGIRRRLAPLLSNNRQRIELMNALLFSLPGTPVIYYGDEIGMGDNIYLGDRNGVRTPMQWSPNLNAGFSDANRQRLYLPVITDPEYHYEVVNVDVQQSNSQSLLWWMKRLIALRKRYKAFGRGTLDFLTPDNRKVLAFVRRYEDETILVVANLSRFAQYTTIDLSPFNGLVPREMLGGVAFPPVGEQPYFLTLSPYAFYWFSLERQRIAGGRIESAARERPIPVVAVPSFDGDLAGLSRGPAATPLTEALLNYLSARGNRREEPEGRHARIADSLAVPTEGSAAIVLVQRETDEGETLTTALPVALAVGEHAATLLDDRPEAVAVRLRGASDRAAVLYDALLDPTFAAALLEVIRGDGRLRPSSGQTVVSVTPQFREMIAADGQGLEPALIEGDLWNTTIRFGERYVLKLFRRLEPGLHPELEIGRLLTDRGFTNAPPLLGSIQYQRGRSGSAVLATLHGYVPNERNGLEHALDTLGRYYERVLASDVDPEMIPEWRTANVDLIGTRPSEEALGLIGTYQEWARLLGHRIAELHLTLAGNAETPDFAPEPFSTLYQRSVYQAMRTTARRAFEAVEQVVAEARRDNSPVPEAMLAAAQEVLALKDSIVNRFEQIKDRKITAGRTRIHGDLHLGQVLHTGKDFVIVDFEGDPRRPASERRLKRSPLRDVAGMLWSFHAAAKAPLANLVPATVLPAEGFPVMQPWASLWNKTVAAVFLQSYLKTAGAAIFLPQSRHELEVLLDVFLLEQAIAELVEALNRSPEAASVPLEVLLQIARSL